MTNCLSSRGIRRFKNRAFKALGFLAAMSLLSVLFILLVKVFIVAQGAFWRTELTLTIPQTHAPSLAQTLALTYPDLPQEDLKFLHPILSACALQRIIEAQEKHKTTVRVPVSSPFDIYYKSPWKKPALLADEKRVFDVLIQQKKVHLTYNFSFFTAGDSREPELAGIGSAFLGSFFVILATLVFSVPLGVFAAIYLNELAPKTTLLGFFDIIIRNLAAVPSLVFGLLGFLVFLHYFELERSSILVGALVLSLMTLPVIITSSRAALNTVPRYIRDGALGLGATKVQTIFHHVLPYAMPGLTTGILLGLSRALGETAPLLMVGMVAFIVDKPTSFSDPATTLPVQIYLWTQSPEAGFLEKASAAILILLFLLFIINMTAVWIRTRYERGR